MLLIQEDLRVLPLVRCIQSRLDPSPVAQKIRVLLTSSEAPLVINTCEMNSQISRLLVLFLNAEPAS